MIGPLRPLEWGWLGVAGLLGLLMAMSFVPGVASRFSSSRSGRKPVASISLRI